MCNFKKKKKKKKSDHYQNLYTNDQRPTLFSFSSILMSNWRVFKIRTLLNGIFNPITVDRIAYYFNCTPVGREIVWVGTFYVCSSAHRGSTGSYLLLQCSGGVV